MINVIVDFVLSKYFIAPIIIIVLSCLFYRLFKKVIYQFINSKFKLGDDAKNKTISSVIVHILKYLLIFIDIVLILAVYEIDTASLIASLGVVGVVLGLSIQDTLKDLFAGVFIILEDQYSTGDIISINDFRGEVIEVGLKTTKLRAYTGEIKIICNRNIVELTNYSKASTLAIVDVSTEYTEDTENIESTLEKVCDIINKNEELLVGKAESIGIVKLDKSGVVFRIIADSVSMKHYEVERLIRREIKKAFAKDNITIPFDQLVIHNGK